MRNKTFQVTIHPMDTCPKSQVVNLWTDGHFSSGVYHGDSIYVCVNGNEITTPENILIRYDPRDFEGWVEIQEEIV